MKMEKEKLYAFEKKIELSLIIDEVADMMGYKDKEEFAIKYNMIINYTIIAFKRRLKKNDKRKNTNNRR